MRQFNVNTAQKCFFLTISVEVEQVHTLCVVKPEIISVMSVLSTVRHLVVFTVSALRLSCPQRQKLI